MGGDFECPRGYIIKVRVNWAGGIGCVAGEPSALAMRGAGVGGGGGRVLLLVGSLLIL